jgi:hypothetical protein
MIHPGLSLGYRRILDDAGRWIARLRSDNRYRVENLRGRDGKVIVADDLAEADGIAILNFAQAWEAALKFAKAEGTVGVAGDDEPATVADEQNLSGRGGDAANATSVRRHLPADPLTPDAPSGRRAVFPGAPLVHEMDIELDADAAKFFLDDATVDRIIAAGGKTPVVPDRDSLRQDLLFCYGRYFIASELDQSGFVKRQSDRLSSFRKHVSKLTELLKADEADKGTIRSVWPITPARMDFILEMIDAVTFMQGKPGDIADRFNANLGVSGSALQWLTGELLPGIYLKHFRKKARTSRSSLGTPGGPYIRFARQVLSEAEIECSDETIASALRMVKS